MVIYLGIWIRMDRGYRCKTVKARSCSNRHDRDCEHKTVIAQVIANKIDVKAD